MRNHPGNLVSRYERERHGHAHVVVHEVDVRVTYTAVLDVDGDIVGPASVPLDCELRKRNNIYRIRPKRLLLGCVKWSLATTENHAT